MNTVTKGVKLADNDIEFGLCEIKALFLKHKIVKHLRNTNSSDKEKNEIIEYLSNNRLTVFPYSYRNDYNMNDIICKKDNSNNMLYIETPTNKLYMKKSYTSEFRAKRYYNNILMEQDSKSPHCYVSDTFFPDTEDIIIDIGGAEGYFPLKYIDTVKAVYIFECNDEWIDALKLTYRDYLDKVHIINKFVSNYSDDTHITLDDFVVENNIENDHLFIKIDAEGSEPLIIKGARTLLNKNKHIKLSLCVYHQANHETIFKKLFSKWNIETAYGYMIYYYDFYIKAPYLRRGVLRIRND